MKIKIKTKFIDFEYEDETTVSSDSYIERVLPKINEIIDIAINAVIKLHDEIKLMPVDEAKGIKPTHCTLVKAPLTKR